MTSMPERPQVSHNDHRAQGRDSCPANRSAQGCKRPGDFLKGVRKVQGQQRKKSAQTDLSAPSNQNSQMNKQIECASGLPVPDFPDESDPGERRKQQCKSDLRHFAESVQP